MGLIWQVIKGVIALVVSHAIIILCHLFGFEPETWLARAIFDLSNNSDAIDKARWILVIAIGLLLLFVEQFFKLIRWLRHIVASGHRRVRYSPRTRKFTVALPKRSRTKDSAMVPLRPAVEVTALFKVHAGLLEVIESFGVSSFADIGNDAYTFNFTERLDNPVIDLGAIGAKVELVDLSPSDATIRVTGDTRQGTIRVTGTREPISAGGRGGNSRVEGSGTAIGGQGGGGGPYGKGGDGGHAHVSGDGFAMGGEGGEAGQADRGGRGGGSPLEILGYPKEFWKYGRGGDGGSPAPGPDQKGEDEAEKP